MIADLHIAGKLILSLSSIQRYCIPMLKRIAAAFLAVLLLLSSIAASSDLIGDALLIADIPITYGDEGFRERIIERTKGERDPVGLVLSGGSARAFAHIGVLKYLEEQGIVPDFIISNSMGSIIGLLYAAGLSPDDIIDFITSADISAMFSFTLPLEGGVMLPSGLEALAEMIVGPDTRLEDLDIPVMVICDDLVTKREIRITEGDFTDILIASFALPFYFPPVEYEGHLLIDGGIVTLLPLETAFEYTDTVIVSTAFYNMPDLNLRNPITVLNASFDIGKNQKAAEAIRSHGDFIWIRCDVESFSFMDFDKAALMAEIGYESAASASEALEGIHRSGVSQALLDDRAELSRRMEEAERSQMFFGRVDTSSPSASLSFDFTSNQEGNERRYLSDTSNLALVYGYRNGPFEAGGIFGGAFNLMTQTVASASLLAEGFMSYYPADSLRLSLEAAFTFGHDPDWYIPHLYVRQGLDWIILHRKGEYMLSFREALEHTTGFVGRNALALSSGVDGDIALGMFHLYGALGYLMTADDIRFGNIHSFIEASFSTRFSPQGERGWFIDGGVFSRVAVDGRGSVPLFLSDGYLSTVLRSGSGYWRSSRYHNTMLSVSTGYDFRVTPTFAEFLILENLGIAAYCDMLIHDAAFDFSAGVGFQSAFSIIGLLEIPLSLRLGYDSLSDGFVASFLLSLRY